MEMGPGIGMIFLLLVFFMVTAKPIVQEADIALGLPGAVAQDEPVDIPDETRIVIAPDGQVSVNEQPIDSPQSKDLPELRAMLERFKMAANNNRSEALVTLAPHDDAPHQRSVDVLSACQGAEITNITFAAAGEEDSP